MLHLVRFITWLLLFLPLSNQFAVSNGKIEEALVRLVPRHYQRTILHGLVQSQATPGENIDPKMVYTFLKKSDVILNNRISENTFQEIYDKLKDSLNNPLMDHFGSIYLSEYETSKDKFKQMYAQEVGKGGSYIGYERLVQYLFTLYDEYCSLEKNTAKSGPDSILNSKKEQSKEEKLKVSLTLELIITHKIRPEYLLGAGTLKLFMSNYKNSPLDRHLLYNFLVEAMQNADSNLTIDQSFTDYLVKLRLFDKTFKPAVNLPKRVWDWASVNAHFYEIPIELSVYYEGKYSTVPEVEIPGTMPLSYIVEEWTQAFKLYQKEKLNLENEKEFKFQRQTEFLCGFVEAFTHRLKFSSLDSSLQPGKVPKAKCTSWSCPLKTGVGVSLGVGIPLALYFIGDIIYKRYYPTGNGTAPANPKTPRPPTFPPLESSSSMLWWIVSIGGVVALLGLIYWNYSNSCDDEESSEEEEEKVPKKKKNPKLKKKAKKKRPKVKAKNRVVKKEMLPFSSSPTSVSLFALPSTLTSQTGTESRATQTPSPKAAANKALVATRNGAPTFPACTLPQTSAGALTMTLTRTPTWETPLRKRTGKTTPALPSNATASQQKQSPKCVAPPTKPKR